MWADSPVSVLPLPSMERVMGIEPTSSAWKAEVLPLNYTRLVTCLFQSQTCYEPDSLLGAKYRAPKILTVRLRSNRPNFEFFNNPLPCAAKILTVRTPSSFKMCLPAPRFAERDQRTGHQINACYTRSIRQTKPSAEPKSGGGGRIRTYVGIASRFTVCPR